MCKVVSREPRLHALGNGTLVGLLALATGQWRGECLSSDVAMCDLLGDESQNAYFDTVVFNPYAQTYLTWSPNASYLLQGGRKETTLPAADLWSWILLLYAAGILDHRQNGPNRRCNGADRGEPQGGLFTKWRVDKNTCAIFSLLWSSIPALCGCLTTKTIELSSLTNSKTKYVKHTL